MEFKGTKGKWKLGASKRGVVNDDKVIVRCAFGENSLGLFKEHEAEANALLISKAPEMLEMLEEFEKNLRSGYVINKNKLNEIQQLIKEATQI